MNCRAAARADAALETRQSSHTGPPSQRGPLYVQRKVIALLDRAAVHDCADV
jgi:hypothetical protein